MGRDVVGRDVGVERPRTINCQERIERIGRDPFAPVGATDPARHLALAGLPQDPIVPTTSSSTTMTLVSTVWSARSLDQRRSNASQSMWSGAVKAAMCTATGSAHLLEEQRQILVPYLPQREPHSGPAICLALKPGCG